MVLGDLIILHPRVYIGTGDLLEFRACSYTALPSPRARCPSRRAAEERPHVDVDVDLDVGRGNQSINGHAMSCLVLSCLALPCLAMPCHAIFPPPMIGFDIAGTPLTLTLSFGTPFPLASVGACVISSDVAPHRTAPRWMRDTLDFELELAWAPYLVLACVALVILRLGVGGGVSPNLIATSSYGGVYFINLSYGMVGRLVVCNLRVEYSSQPPQRSTSESDILGFSPH
ncbi:hypothetical protein EYC84_001932 [Monilinia fructicola]|uniref:Uncharacterized protein n=1 Tax=Monilinia fructicola TaxID=38448 RepID=A0A5M9JU65_MONFR|nr:hypothetical protein EYC84_001932 [Monilinia fructicola]